MGCKWQHASLGDICRLVGGSAFPRRYQGQSEGVPFIKVSDMNLSSNGWMICKASNHVNEKVLVDIGAKKQPRGATVFAKIGEALKADRTRMLTTETAIDNNMMAAIPKSGTDKWFLYYLISWLRLSNYAEGSALPYLKQSTLNKIPITLPNSEVAQRKVVEILYELDSQIKLNTAQNGYLGELCESIASRQMDTAAKLSDLCYQVNDKKPYADAVLQSYVSTESLLVNKGGRQTASSLPSSGKVTQYKVGDTLVSNIRPYFKKVWFADQDGTCSGDVIVFRAREAQNAPYVYSLLRTDSFFDWVMRGSKGTKMPRGDKKQMMAYPICPSCENADLSFLSSAVNKLCANERENERLSKVRDTLLPKLMSGEMNVSKVDATQPNSHLYWS